MPQSYRIFSLLLTAQTNNSASKLINPIARNARKWKGAPLWKHPAWLAIIKLGLFDFQLKSSGLLVQVPIKKKISFKI
jgi:hypothetical protein